jgi:small GTP-binding protein
MTTVSLIETMVPAPFIETMAPAFSFCRIDLYFLQLLISTSPCWQATTMLEFNITILGSAQVGKTTLISKLVQCEMEKGPTTCFKQHTTYVRTNHGKIKLNFRDTCGQDVGRRDGYAPMKDPVHDAHSVWFMLDIGDKQSNDALPMLDGSVKDSLTAQNVDIERFPFIVLGNKLDDPERTERKVKPKKIKFPKANGRDYPYWAISAMEGKAWKGGCQGDLEEVKGHFRDPLLHVLQNPHRIRRS